jgi:hypothetical protein
MLTTAKHLLMGCRRAKPAAVALHQPLESGKHPWMCDVEGGRRGGGGGEQRVCGA